VGGSWGGVGAEGASAVAGAANERAKGREQLREVGDGADERAPPVGERRGKREGGLAVAPGCRLGQPRIERRGRELVGVDIWEHNKEWIRKRTNIGEHFTREVIQSIVFIFLPLGKRVHLTNLVYYY